MDKWMDGQTDKIDKTDRQISQTDKIDRQTDRFRP
jgi:hypothetical protein